MAKPRIDQSVQQQIGQCHHRDYNVVEMDVGRQIDPAAHRGPPRQAQAIVPAPGLERHHEEIQHLRKRQRDHDEVHPLGAQADGPHQQSRQRTHQGSQWPRQPGRHHAHAHQDASGVAPEAHKRRMAEADHAAPPQNQIQTGSGQGIHQHPADHTHIKILTQRFQNNRQQQ